MSETPRVVVIGASAIDIKAVGARSIQLGTANPGKIRIGVGGVGRNVAENLTRLGVSTTLISAIGDDGSGRRIQRQAAQSGLDLSEVLVDRSLSTATYVALFEAAGSPLVSMYDMAIINRITPRYIYERRAIFRDADFVLIDANLPPSTLNTVLKLAGQYRLRVGADPTSVMLAPRLQPHLSALHMITPDQDEAEVLTGMKVRDPVEAIEAAKRLVGRGIRVAIVTLAEQGVVYATGETSGRIPSIRTDITDVVGAGDAMTAAVVFGLLNDFPVDEAVRLGVSAASLTLQCRETVCPYLSLERLYDNLVV